MKKEKKVRTYQRRTKSGKLVTVKAHTAKYDAAERAKELAKKKGAGDELEERKKKKSMKSDVPFDKDEKELLDDVKEVVEKTSKKSKKDSAEKTSKKTKAKETKSTTSEPAFTAAEFKEWYQGTGSAADKKVAKALRAQLGRSGYKKLEDEAIDNYTPRGHLSMFKRVGSEGGVKEKVSEAKVPKSSKDARPDFLHPHEHYEYTPSVKKKLYALKAKLDESHTTWVTKFGNGKKGSEAEREKFLRKQNKLEEQYDKLVNSSSKKTAAYKKYTEDLRKYHLGERSREENAERAAKRKQSSDNKAIYEKYGVTRKEVVDYMRSTPRKWKWDSESNAFLAKSEKKTGRVYDSVSLENAIRRMQRASKPKEAETTIKPQAKSVRKTKRMTPKETAEFIQKSDWIYGGE